MHTNKARGLFKTSIYCSTVYQYKRLSSKCPKIQKPTVKLKCLSSILELAEKYAVMKSAAPIDMILYLASIASVLTPSQMVLS